MLTYLRRQEMGQDVCMCVCGGGTFNPISLEWMEVT